METLIENSRVFTQAANVHFNNARIADQIGVQLAGAYLCYSNSVINLDDALKWIAGHNWEDITTVNLASDDQRLLNRLMTSEIKVDLERSTSYMNIGEVILKTRDNKILYEPALRRIGIIVEDGRFYIANDSDPLKNILKDTPWNSNWPRVLREIDGAERHNTRYFVAGIKCRSVSLPISLIIKD
jgi:hypothetical protein